MKTTFSKEELIHSLPDFISDNIDDKDLISQIENEINTNSGFKFEFDELRKTFLFLNSASLDGPQDSYFNNLPVRINEKINGKHVNPGFIEKLGLLWKILIPALSIIIIAVILYNIFGDKDEESKVTHDSNNQKVIEKNQTDNKIEPPPQNDLVTPDDKEKNTTDLPKDKPVKQGNRNKKHNRTIYETKEENNLSEEKVTIIQGKVYADLINDPDETNGNEAEEDVLYIEDGEEDNLEEEFLKLTPEQQKEIIDNLNNTQI